MANEHELFAFEHCDRCQDPGRCTIVTRGIGISVMANAEKLAQDLTVRGLLEEEQPDIDFGDLPIYELSTSELLNLASSAREDLKVGFIRALKEGQNCSFTEDQLADLFEQAVQHEAFSIPIAPLTPPDFT